MLPRLHVVTDDETLARPGWAADAARLLVTAGQEMALHLRGPRTSGRRLHGLAKALWPAAERSGSLLVVNDRLDVALACGTPAHLGRRSLDVRDARALLGPRTLLGVSCHEADEVREAGAGGADFVFAGTVFSTPSHPGRQGRGVEWIATVIESAGALPVVAIGGIGAGEARSVRGVGAWGVAVLRGVWDAPDPDRAVVEYIQALNA